MATICNYKWLAWHIGLVKRIWHLLSRYGDFLGANNDQSQYLSGSMTRAELPICWPPNEWRSSGWRLTMNETWWHLAVLGLSRNMAVMVFQKRWEAHFMPKKLFFFFSRHWKNSSDLVEIWKDFRWVNGVLTFEILGGGLEHGFFDFPYIGNNNPNWLIFFRWVETTNQLCWVQIHGTSS